LLKRVRRALIPPAEAPMTITLGELFEGTLNALTLQLNSEQPQNILGSFRGRASDAGKNDATGERDDSAMVDEQSPRVAAERRLSASVRRSDMASIKSTAGASQAR
jgi:hypothetical protein